ncbi:ArsR/SmtB family transcription factor [Psychromicrobium lacuslunae]|uniref:HTH arsR-type domain-containing protein n=1 Tax=Psychromicrobium lacuslunae TaxID=1618207 RepID=A0A0D4BZQ9_9MICC|nr:metalloregulator ArsR/SmtB family transcription factor [Psychromicrobium lacuslunae]AJT41625.1 hypothetical protein UM93_09095 [Psychromicrobium lacuslunae]
MPEVFHADPKDVTLPTILAALSDPLRLSIVSFLANHGESECNAIYQGVGTSKTNASHHFRILREAGLIRRHHEGQKQTARLRRDEVDEYFPHLLDAVLANAVPSVEPSGSEEP